MKQLKCDIAVIGASLGGLRAALSAAKLGKKVILTEETDWVGGQLTSQAVPPDENSYIETQGATKSYLDYRKKVRQYYSELPTIKEEFKSAKIFDPGDSWVSRIAHEPKVALAIFEEELKPYYENGLIRFLPFTVAVSAQTEKDDIESLVLKNLKNEEKIRLCADIYVDGTDTGDLLPIVGAEYVTGAESFEQTHEPHAPKLPLPQDMQPATWVFALEMVDELLPQDKIEKPKNYDYYASMKANYDDNLILSWYCIELNSKKKRELRMFSGEVKDRGGLWEYRRIKGQSRYIVKINELSLINWPQQDYIFGNLFETDDAEHHKREAKEFSKCLAYWIQNEAPRKEGGYGYSVRLSPDTLGTDDGFAKAPYIRESRRIIAKETVREQDVSVDYLSNPKRYFDSVGVGHYCMDLHETIVSHSVFNKETNPFEIPLGALIPIRIKNLIPACKNIGTTHFTSSCYRLHPIEWNIGESAGYLAAFCLANNVKPVDVYNDLEMVRQFQAILIEAGVQLHWEL